MSSISGRCRDDNKRRRTVFAGREQNHSGDGCQLEQQQVTGETSSTVSGGTSFQDPSQGVCEEIQKRRRLLLSENKEQNKIKEHQSPTIGIPAVDTGELLLPYSSQGFSAEGQKRRRLLSSGTREHNTIIQRQPSIEDTSVHNGSSVGPSAICGNDGLLQSSTTVACGENRASQSVASSKLRKQPKGVNPRKKAAPIKYCSLNDQLYTCPGCKAIMWYEERVKMNSNRRRINFSLCCSEGKIRLPVLDDPPEILKRLLDYTQPGYSSSFRQLIRMYNSCFQFTSMGAKVDQSVNRGRGCYVFRISGQVNHWAGSLLPTNDKAPSFLQLYVYDSSSELQMRANTVGKQEGSPDLDPDILSGLKQMLDDVSPLAHMFRTAGERLKEDDNLQLSIRLIGTRENKPRVYNKPTTSEIAALIVGDTSDNSAGRDIIIEHRSDGLQRINELHPSYMALQYPLLFPYGEDSFYIGIKYYYDETSSNKKKRKRESVTMREYYAYRLQQRLSDGYALQRGGKLLQQFIVDCCCAIESERLWYIRRNQSSIRCDMLNNICDAVSKGDYIGAEVGMRIFLPSSFTGGPRYMQANYQDAMTICRFYGNPHLFITFTANPKWPEVDIMLRNIPGQRPEDRPDIMTRVFKLKLIQLMDCLKKDRYFGDVVADIYTIEFQKRGLPHAHILLWLKKDGSQVSPEYIDSIIKAEIPNQEEEPELYNIVSQFMVHGLCGEDNPSCSCMINNTCSKKYPKKSCEQTTIDHNGYPVYRRREDKRYIKKGVHTMDNRHIVPYNPGLLLMFNAHINVEWCNTARAIKYLFKYILKGPDKATVLLKSEKEDEIKAYLDCRYLSACEASWRIFGFDIHQRNPSVIRLPVHLPGEQFVVLSDTSNLQGVINRANSCHTKLTGWFAANERDPEARKLTYAQFPTEYVWKDGWIRRSKGRSVGRIAYVHPTAGERYYLRLLLNVVKGPKSFEDLRTIDNQLYPSYKGACFAYGLLSDDKEWHEAMSEANRWAMPYQLRELFVTILLFCEVTDIKTFRERHITACSQRILREKRGRLSTTQHLSSKKMSSGHIH
ncbi:uncharacterized protein LOC141649809 [Silene latifolia]|uniref:uncharacterized protein LOC141649809 n=1 Tax=Silene latifolia TaxID=37657 RepID=UPI003D78330F